MKNRLVHEEDIIMFLEKLISITIHDRISIILNLRGKDYHQIHGYETYLVGHSEVEESEKHMEVNCCLC